MFTRVLRLQQWRFQVLVRKLEPCEPTDFLPLVREAFETMLYTKLRKTAPDAEQMKLREGANSVILGDDFDRQMRRKLEIVPLS